MKTFILQINPIGFGLTPPNAITGYLVIVNWATTGQMFESLDSAPGKVQFICRNCSSWREAYEAARHAICEVRDKEAHEALIRGLLATAQESLVITVEVNNAKASVKATYEWRRLRATQ